MSEEESKVFEFAIGLPIMAIIKRVEVTDAGYYLTTNDGVEFFISKENYASMREQQKANKNERHDDEPTQVRA